MFLLPQASCFLLNPEDLNFNSSLTVKTFAGIFFDDVPSFWQRNVDLYKDNQEVAFVTLMQNETKDIISQIGNITSQSIVYLHNDTKIFYGEAWNEYAISNFINSIVDGPLVTVNNQDELDFYQKRYENITLFLFQDTKGDKYKELFSGVFKNLLKYPIKCLYVKFPLNPKKKRMFKTYSRYTNKTEIAKSKRKFTLAKIVNKHVYPDVYPYSNQMRYLKFARHEWFFVYNDAGAGFTNQLAKVIPKLKQYTTIGLADNTTMNNCLRYGIDPEKQSLSLIDPRRTGLTYVYNGEFNVKSIKKFAKDAMAGRLDPLEGKMTKTRINIMDADYLMKIFFGAIGVCILCTIPILIFNIREDRRIKKGLYKKKYE